MDAVENAIATVMGLPSADRLRIAQELWDSVTSESQPPQLSEAQLEEVKRRKALADADPGSMLTEEEFWRALDGE